MASYTAEQFWKLLDRLHGTDANLNIHPETWEDMNIERQEHKLASQHLNTVTLTVSVEAGDGDGWFVVAVCKITTHSQDEFDEHPWSEKALYAFHQHDGDGGNAEGSLATWYHTMQMKYGRRSLILTVS